MMRGLASAATAVRSGEKILVVSERLKVGKNAETIKKIPFVRGIYNFIMSMVYGVGTLNKSASAAGDDSEPTKFEKWVAKNLKIKAETLTAAIAVILGLAFAVGLFVVLPQLIIQPFVNFNIKLSENWSGLEGFLNSFLKNLLTGIIRIAIFLVYLILISRMKDIKRVFSYHGAEHKVINCYEFALPLTVANVKKMTVKHERCGTTFMFLVMLVGVLFFSFFTFDDNILLRTLTRIALLPAVAGISYEVLMFSAKHDNLFFRILRAPGMLLQKLTTNEPSDDMIEVSLAAFKTVLAMDADAKIPISSFENTLYPYSFVRDFIRENAAEFPPDEAEWIMAAALKKGRAALPLTEVVTLDEFEEMKEIIKKRRTGMPLQRAVGLANFFGLDLDIEDALIPRPETELLVDELRKYIENLSSKNFVKTDNFPSEAYDKIGGIDSQKTDSFSTEIYGKIGGMEPRKIRVLDLATGSGAIAIALSSFFDKNIEITASNISETTAQNDRKNHPTVEVTASEISEFTAQNDTQEFHSIDETPASDISKSAQNKPKEFRPIVEITASDISEAALKTARKNAEKHGAKINFIRGDMLENVGGGYDIIISNPPYIKTADIACLDREVRYFEPKIALDGGEDGLRFYREIASKILNERQNETLANGNDSENSRILNDGGRLFLEIGAGQREGIKEIFERAEIEFIKDYSGIDRIAIIKI
jgi:uncharacterized protein YqhQ/methylase of polypeptide subunit release factors